MTKCAIYARVSTPDQCLENQLYTLRELSTQRGFSVIQEYTDIGSGSKARRVGLEALLKDSHRHMFSIVLVAAFDGVARSVKHFLAVVDELESLNIQFVSAREAIDTNGPMGRMFITLVSSIAELERSIIIERIKAGMRRRKMDGLPCGRAPLDVDRRSLVRDRLAGMSLTKVAKKYSVSRASVVRFTREAVKAEAAQVSEFQPETARSSVECVA